MLHILTWTLTYSERRALEGFPMHDCLVEAWGADYCDISRTELEAGFNTKEERDEAYQFLAGFFEEL